MTGAGWHGLGAPGPQAQAIAFRDGRVAVRTGTQDIGTGTRTILAMIAAEELGLPLTTVSAEIGDTRLLFSVPSGRQRNGALEYAFRAPGRGQFEGQALSYCGEPARRRSQRTGSAGLDDSRQREPSRAISFADVCRRIPGDSLSAEGEHAP